MDEVTWTERWLAIIGLMIGGAVAYMSIDLLFGGMVTRSLTRSVKLASVTHLPVAEEPPAS